MKTLIVYYSRTGHCRKVAEAIAAALPADIEEIVDLKDRSGAVNYLIAGKDAAMKRDTTIQPPAKDPSGYDLVIIGSPVWAFTMAPAVRTWISRHADKLRRVAMFCTMGGSGDNSTIKNMAELAGTGPVTTLALTDRQIKSGDYSERVIEFAAKLNAMAAPDGPKI